MIRSIIALLLILCQGTATKGPTVTKGPSTFNPGVGNPFTLTNHHGTDTTSAGTTFVNSFSVVGNITGQTICVAAGWLNTSINVSGVSDNAGNSTYIQAVNARANNTTGGFSTDLWCVASSAGTNSLIQITITFSGTTGSYRAMELWIFSRSGPPVPSFDIGNNVSNATGSGTTINGPSATTTSTTGFGVAIVIVNTGAITENPKVGNEFTAGGDLLTLGGNAAASVITTTAASHQPAWTDATSNDIYCSSAAWFK